MQLNDLLIDHLSLDVTFVHMQDSWVLLRLTPWWRQVQQRRHLQLKDLVQLHHLTLLIRLQPNNLHATQILLDGDLTTKRAMITRLG